MVELKKLKSPVCEEFRRATQGAESLRLLVETQQRQADQLAKALRPDAALRLTEAQRQATMCAKTLGSLTAPYRPAIRQIEAFSAELPRAIDPYRAVIASVTQWERSLVARMEALKTSWVLPDRFEQSIIGFARLSRLSDAVHTKKPYSTPVAELVASELGDSIETLPEDSASERDEAALRAGLNSELISFPSETYSEVVLAAGFNFRIPRMPAPQAVESADSGAVLNPNHREVIAEVELSLRDIVEKKLSKLSGQSWIKNRVSQPMRKRWEERQEEDRSAGRPVYSPVQYADFMDLADIIGQSNNWKEAFEPIFKNKDDFIVSLRRLHPVRKAIAHSRPLSRVDILTLVNESTRIFAALGRKFLS